MSSMPYLYLIPARGGSKGIPRKNVKLLGNKSLIAYSIETAMAIAQTNDVICVSSDDDEIIAAATQCGLSVAFKRPAQLATDTAGTYPVILHALNYYAQQQQYFDAVVLLQPTSPFRRAEQVQAAITKFDATVDMVVSVIETAANPYYVLYEEDAEGYLQKSKTANFVRRQDCPTVYELNGAIYVINTQSLRKYQSFAQFKRLRKYHMPQQYHVDLDTPLDWAFAEFLIEKGFITF